MGSRPCITGSSFRLPLAYCLRKALDRKQQVCLDGSRSGWRIVLSAFPQGLVLGPLLFLIFINDLDLNITSSVFKSADDTKIIGTVKDSTDSERLQADVDTLYQWAGTWQMKFNISKCKVMHLGRRNASLQYCMNGQSLEEVTSYRDLGVIMSSHLKVNEHCQEAYRKANRMLGLVKRTTLVLVRLYKSLVRPHLEYCSPVWSPHFQKDKSLLKRVQYRFTRLFLELRSLSDSAIMTGWKVEVVDAWRKEKQSRFDQTVHDVTWCCFSPSSEFFHTSSLTHSNTWPFLETDPVALMQGDSSFLFTCVRKFTLSWVFESSTNGTAFHKSQLMPAQWTCSRTSWTKSGTQDWFLSLYFYPEVCKTEKVTIQYKNNILGGKQ